MMYVITEIIYFILPRVQIIKSPIQTMCLSHTENVPL